MACQKYGKIDKSFLSSYSNNYDQDYRRCVDINTRFVPIGLYVPCNMDPCYYVRKFDVNRLCFENKHQKNNRITKCGKKKERCKSCN